MGVLRSYTWTEEDYRALVTESFKGRFEPEYFLCVAQYESGLNPTAFPDNYPGTQGLNQLTPANRTNLGVPTHKDFRDFAAAEQMIYCRKYYDSRVKLAGGRWLSAHHMYLATIAPARLPLIMNAAGVVYSRDDHKREYMANRQLDMDHNGIIEVRDLYEVMRRSSLTPKYKAAVTDLNKLLQKGINARLGPADALKEDGIIGAKTMDALSKLGYQAVTGVTRYDLLHT